MDNNKALGNFINVVVEKSIYGVGYALWHFESLIKMGFNTKPSKDDLIN